MKDTTKKKIGSNPINSITGLDSSLPWIEFINTIDLIPSQRTRFLNALPNPGAVTQGTNTTTGVTLNAQSGVITAFTSTAAALTNAAFVLTNSSIIAASAVVATVANYSGTIITNGIPTVYISGIAAGSCTVNVTNVHAANALAGIVKISFAVV